jgi:hypothetical protein
VARCSGFPCTLLTGLVLCAACPGHDIDTRKAFSDRSYEVLFSIHGDPLFAERAETLAFNALPAELTEDMWAHQYLQQPNAIAAAVQADPPFWHNDGADATTMNLEPNFPCCTGNFNQVLLAHPTRACSDPRIRWLRRPLSSSGLAQVHDKPGGGGHTHSRCRGRWRYSHAGAFHAGAVYCDGRPHEGGCGWDTYLGQRHDTLVSSDSFLAL